VKNSYGTQLEPESSQQALALADRLDPAIGEATSVMGAMLTELVRRSLRGGVLRIGDELNTYVNEQVEVAITERTPALEQVAADVADKAARVAATEIATEEVQALERRTQEQDQGLSVQIEETARAAQQRTDETARDLAARIVEAQSHVQTETKEVTRALANQIQEAERRVADTAREELATQVEQLKERARERSERMKARFQALEETATQLEKKHAASRQELIQLFQEAQSRLQSDFEQLQRVNESLHTRLAQLEKPRGIKAWFGGLFGSKDKSDKAALANPTSEDSD
jgi:DNA repair exonuclease SbcCD ATPase subunit